MGYDEFAAEVSRATADDATRASPTGPISSTSDGDALRRVPVHAALAPISFWRGAGEHKDAPRDVAYDPSCDALADDPNGPNKDVIAMLIQMADALYGLRGCTRGVAPHHAIPLIKAAAKKHNSSKYITDHLGALRAAGLCEWAASGHAVHEKRRQAVDDGAAEGAAEEASAGRPEAGAQLAGPRHGRQLVGEAIAVSSPPSTRRATGTFRSRHAPPTNVAALVEPRGGEGGKKAGWTWRVKHMADGDAEYVAEAGGAMLIFNGDEE